MYHGRTTLAMSISLNLRDYCAPNVRMIHPSQTCSLHQVVYIAFKALKAKACWWEGIQLECSPTSFPTMLASTSLPSCKALLMITARINDYGQNCRQGAPDNGQDGCSYAI
eukprot:c42068_g1_i1 orf=118-450(+)